MTQNKGKVLLIYPAFFKLAGLPLGIASLSAVLKKNGYEVKVFDTTFYDLNNQKDWDKLRADRLMSKRVANEEDHWQIKTTDIKDDLIKLIKEYEPKMVGITVTEPTYEMSLMLTRLIKQYFSDIIVVAGGVLPTLSPDMVIQESSIDIICRGEGENSLLELCDKIYSNGDFRHVKGLWVKDGEEIYKNKPGKLPDLNDLPHPDFSVFPEALFYKPMQGKIYKMANIETSRGCPYNCTFCSSPRLKEFSITNGCGSYYRNMKMKKIIEQIHYQINTHSPEFIYFSSETFLAMSQEDFDLFIEEYKKIKMPFWFQTRFETITEERIKALKDVGMFWMTMGVEHGNEEFRRNVLKRTYSNEAVIKGVTILNKCGVGASLNNMMGFPFETRELIFDTIKLNKKLFEINDKLEFNVFMFVPFGGCELYDLCKKEGFLPERPYSTGSGLSDESTLNFSKDYKEELKGLMKTFNLYIKLPSSFWPQIKIAERSDKEGAAMFQKLSQLLEK